MEQYLTEVLTAPEAERLWGLQPGTVRAACGRKIIIGRKSAGTWLTTKAAMAEHYGPQKEGDVMEAYVCGGWQKPAR